MADRYSLHSSDVHSTSLYGGDIGNTWHGQRSLSRDSSLEDSVSVRSGVVGGGCGYKLWHGCAEHDPVSETGRQALTE